MVEWKVGDMLVSDVTQRATVYTVTSTKIEGEKQVVTISVSGREFGGCYSADLFEMWMPPMDDTRDYLDSVTNYAERNENEIS